MTAGITPVTSTGVDFGAAATATLHYLIWRHQSNFPDTTILVPLRSDNEYHSPITVQRNWRTMPERNYERKDYWAWLESPLFSSTSLKWQHNNAISATSRSNRSLLTSRLRRLRGLNHDWDSYGAIPVTREALLSAERFLKSLESSLPDELLSKYWTPSVLGARADGGILVEWEGRKGIFELHIEPDGTRGYFAEDMESGRVSEADSAPWSDLVSQLATALL